MARKFGANCSKCQRSTEQQQSIKCFKIHGKDLLQNNDFHITSSIFLLSSVLVFYFFLILFFNSIVYRFFIARIFGVLPEYFRDWGGCRPPRPPGSYAYAHGLSCVVTSDDPQEWASAIRSVRDKDREIRLWEFDVVRGAYAKKYSWKEQCDKLVERMKVISLEG